MIRQSSWDRGDLHKSARVCWGLLCGINYLSFKQRPDLSNRMSPTCEGGRWAGLGGRPRGRQCETPAQHSAAPGRPHMAPSCSAHHVCLSPPTSCNLTLLDPSNNQASHLFLTPTWSIPTSCPLLVTLLLPSLGVGVLIRVGEFTHSGQIKTRPGASLASTT